MNAIKDFYKRLPKWLKPTNKQIKAFKVLLKATIKGIIIAGTGVIANKYGANGFESLAISAVTHPILKWLDPTDKSIGINKE